MSGDVILLMHEQTEISDWLQVLGKFSKQLQITTYVCSHPCPLQKMVFQCCGFSASIFSYCLRSSIGVRGLHMLCDITVPHSYLSLGMNYGNYRGTQSTANLQLVQERLSYHQHPKNGRETEGTIKEQPI